MTGSQKLAVTLFYCIRWYMFTLMITKFPEQNQYETCLINHLPFSFRKKCNFIHLCKFSHVPHLYFCIRSVKIWILLSVAFYPIKFLWMGHDFILKPLGMDHTLFFFYQALLASTLTDIENFQAVSSSKGYRKSAIFAVVHLISYNRYIKV